MNTQPQLPVLNREWTRFGASPGAEGRARFLFVLIVIASLGGCARKEEKVNPQEHTKEISAWQERRLTRLKADDGWLTLAGLYWLSEGKNAFGSDSSNAVILPPGKAPSVAGYFVLRDSAVSVEVLEGVEVKSEGKPVTTLALQSDDDPAISPTMLEMGPVTFYVIKRGDKFGIRIKDKENSARLNFKGIELYPISPLWRFTATFEPYDSPRTLPIVNVFGMEAPEQSLGKVRFEHNGATYRLETILEKGSDELFIIFSDETSGKETYGMGRYLYTAMADSNNNVILDFNKAYNPPCAFTNFATCPVPPKENRLPFRVEAGEKNYDSSH